MDKLGRLVGKMLATTLELVLVGEVCAFTGRVGIHGDLSIFQGVYSFYVGVTFVLTQEIMLHETAGPE